MSPTESLQREYERIAASCALFATRRLSRSIAKLYDAALAPSGFRGTQYNVLVAIARGHGESLTHLGEVLGMDRTALTHALRPLVSARLVRNVASQDARSRGVALTALGERRVFAAIKQWQRAQDVIEGTLGADRWQALNLELRRLNRAVANSALCGATPARRRLPAPNLEE